MIRPPATLGMLGGGQLGRFFVVAARELGYRTWVLDPDAATPAGAVADRHLVAAYDDAAALDELAAGCAAVTTEFENVPAATLAHLAARTVVRPSPAAVSVCQDRVAEKTFLRDNGFAVAPFAVVPGEVRDHLFPGLLKTARFGYDGKGQVGVERPDDLAGALASLGVADAILEQKVALDLELSVVLARGADGEVRAFAPAENEHVGGILDTSIVPARVDGALRDEATALASDVAAALGFVGTLGVELFVSNGQLLVNELAPRPHNSGHFTLDGCVTDQFEQQLRALCGLPLGDPSAHSATCGPTTASRTGRPCWRSRTCACTCTARPNPGPAARWATSRSSRRTRRRRSRVPPPPAPRCHAEAYRAPMSRRQYIPGQLIMSTAA